MTINMELIPFHGGTLTYLERDGVPYTALKLISDRLGLSWPAQYRKVCTEPTRWGYCSIAIPSTGGEQETICLPVNRVAMWLASVSPRKVKPELRDALIRYQTEAADVLDRHFRLKREEDAAVIADLKAMLARCHGHLMMALPKWAAIREAARLGASWPYIARKARLAKDAADEEWQEMQRCGLVVAGDWQDITPRSMIDRIEELEYRLRLDRAKRQSAETGQSVSDAFMVESLTPIERVLSGEAG